MSAPPSPHTLGERLRERAKPLVFGSPLGGAARRVRALAVERRYARTAARYRGAPALAPEVLLRRRGGARLERFRALGRRPRVLYVGTDAFQDHSGLLDGLAEHAEVTAFVQEDGTYGQPSAAGLLAARLAAPNGRRVLTYLERAAEPFDLVIGQMWGGYIDGTALDEARERFGVLVVNIGMDDRHAYDLRKGARRIGTRLLAPHIDLHATAAPETVHWFLCEGVAACFFPEASDPRLFAPRPEVVPDVDVGFVGQRYGIRARLVERLRAAGVDVAAYGSGWEAGRLPVDDVPLLFARARIVLGVGTIGHSERLLALKLRDFDATMAGACYLTQDNPDLHPLFVPDEEIACYRDADDLVRRVRGLLAEPARREEIGRRARARALRDHTWARRFGDLFAVLRGPDGDG